MNPAAQLDRWYRPARLILLVLPPPSSPVDLVDLLLQKSPEAQVHQQLQMGPLPQPPLALLPHHQRLLVQLARRPLVVHPDRGHRPDLVIQQLQWLQHYQASLPLLCLLWVLQYRARQSLQLSQGPLKGH